MKLFFQIKGKLKKFKDEEIAKEIGINDNQIYDKLINAYQLYDTNAKSELSNKLKDRAITKIEDDIQTKPQINYQIPFKGKKFVISILMFILFSAILFNSGFSNAAIRLLNPTKEYEIPKPFKIINNYLINEILEGDSLNLVFEIDHKNPPDSIDIVISDKTGKKMMVAHYINKKYVYRMENILNDFTYWAEYKSKSILDPWDKIESIEHDISIIKRPLIN